MQKKFVLVEFSPSGQGNYDISTAKSLGLNPIILTQSSALRGLDYAVNLDTFDQRKVEFYCEELFKKHELLGISTTSEYHSPIVANIAKKFGLPGPNPDIIKLCRSKRDVRNLIDTLGYNPKFRWVSSVREAVEASLDIGFPVVVKPINLTGSALVRGCNSVEEVHSISSILINLMEIDRIKLGKGILIEKMAEGEEFSVELINGKAVGITTKVLSPLPYFIEIGADYPACLPSNDTSALITSAEKIAEAIGLNWGPAHIEVRLCPEGPILMEVNPRIGGVPIPELIELATGYNMLADYFRLCSGIPCIWPSNKKNNIKKFSSVRSRIIEKSGILKEVNGLDFAKSMPGVFDIHFNKNRLGKKCTIQGSNGDLLVDIITVGNTLEESIAYAEAASEEISIVIE